MERQDPEESRYDVLIQMDYVSIVMLHLDNKQVALRT